MGVPRRREIPCLRGIRLVRLRPIPLGHSPYSCGPKISVRFVCVNGYIAKHFAQDRKWRSEHGHAERGGFDPDGEGSTYAPALKNSAINMDYYDFVDTVVNGRKKVGASENSVMPAFGTNPNVMCYLDDIYTYLKAHGSGAIGRGRPAQKEAKSDVFAENEDACMGS